MAVDFPTEIARYAYKPGWTLECLPTTGSRHEEFDDGDWFLRISLTVIESSNTSETITTTCDFPLGSLIEDEATLDGFVRSALLYVEAHECDEFMRKDGRRIFTPAHHGAGSSILRALTLKYMRKAGNTTTPVLAQIYD